MSRSVRNKSTYQRVDSSSSSSNLGIAIVKEKRMRLPNVFCDSGSDKRRSMGGGGRYIDDAYSHTPRICAAAC